MDGLIEKFGNRCHGIHGSKEASCVSAYRGRAAPAVQLDESTHLRHVAPPLSTLPRFVGGISAWSGTTGCPLFPAANANPALEVELPRRATQALPPRGP